MKIAALLYFSLIAISSTAQDVQTDQPDQTDGASVVGRHKVQLESQLYYVSYSDHPASFISSTLLRVGLLNNLEGRFETDQGLRRHPFISGTAEGAFPVAAGLKYTLIKDRPVFPDLGIIADVQLPFTNRHSEHQYWSPSVALAVEKKIRQVNIALNAGVRQEAFEKQAICQLSGDVKLEVGRKFELFVEYFTQLKQHALANQNADAGILCHINRKLVVFGAFGERIFSHESTSFVSSGLAVSF
ncbi:MAG: transporter [Chitinophagaceae bacterium]|nr:MAG: transporter [Chitinophagaceae bacterium]